jgi:hypothetical protein
MNPPPTNDGKEQRGRHPYADTGYSPIDRVEPNTWPSEYDPTPVGSTKSRRERIEDELIEQERQRRQGKR